MESLSSFMKQFENSGFMREVEERRQRLLTDPLIMKWRSKHPEVREEDLRMNMNRLYQYVREYHQCEACPGIERCPNDMEGHYTRLSVERVQDSLQIIDHKVACKKHTARQEELSLKRRIRSFYVDNSALRAGLKFEDILGYGSKERGVASTAVLRYIKQTQQHGLQNKGLYLSGDFGTGKTFLLCYMLMELAKSGFTGVIIYMPDFIEDLKAMFHEPQRLKETIELLKETDLLVFDDIGAENLNPWVRDHILGAILNYRMNRKPTFYTSNMDLQGLEAHFSFTSKDGDDEHKGARLMDRIRPFVEVVPVVGENLRNQ